MGRPEKAVDPTRGPVQRFAHELRQLRRQAGERTYREMARRVHYSVTVLSDAARGERAPSLDVTLAYVRACDGETGDWSRRWWRLQEELRAVGRSVAVGGRPAGAPAAPARPAMPAVGERFTAARTGLGLLLGLGILIWTRARR